MPSDIAGRRVAQTVIRQTIPSHKGVTCGCTRTQDPETEGAEPGTRRESPRDGQRDGGDKEEGSAGAARGSPLCEGRRGGRAAVCTEERRHGRRGEGVQRLGG